MGQLGVKAGGRTVRGQMGGWDTRQGGVPDKRWGSRQGMGVPGRGWGSRQGMGFQSWDEIPDKGWDTRHRWVSRHGMMGYQKGMMGGQAGVG